MRTGPAKVMVSGRVPEREKRKLKEMNKNVTHAVHYFVDQVSDPIGSLEVDIYFLKQEINELKMELIVKEQYLDGLTNSLDEAKRKSPKYYPEVYLQEAASDFLRLFNTSDYYKGMDIHDALDAARTGLVNKVKEHGFDFEDVVSEVLKQDALCNTREYYDSSKNFRRV